MGLKGITEVKKLIQEWFPEARLTLEHIALTRKNVSVVIEDFSVKINNIGPVAYNITRLKHDVQRHAPRTFVKFPKCQMLISLIDDPKHTPAAKVPEQKNRAARPHFEEIDIEVLGPLSYLSQHGVDKDSEENELKRQIGSRMRKDENGKNKGTIFHLFMNLMLGTRSRKVDVAHFFTREIIQSPPETFNIGGVKRRIVLDGAVWPENKRANRLRLGEEDETVDPLIDMRDTLLYDYENSLEYDTCALSIGADGARRMSQDQRPLLGEADIKIVSWLNQVVQMLDTSTKGIVERDDSKKLAIWVDCVDTDLIPILLLWTRELIDPVTGTMKYRLFLDCTSSSSAKKAEKNLTDEEKELMKKYPTLDHKWSQSVEVYDIPMLWRRINTTFFRIFPGISFPVETFCVLLMMGGTDFVEKPRDLAMGGLWRAFCVGGYSILARAVIIPSETKKGHVFNEDRRVGLIESLLKEFYIFAYSTRLLTNRVKFGLVDRKKNYLRASSMDDMNFKIKEMNSARRKANTHSKNIGALKERIGFNGEVIGAIDHQIEANLVNQGCISNKTKEELATKGTIDSTIKNLVKELYVEKTLLSRALMGVVESAASGDADAVAKRETTPYDSIVATLSKTRKASSSHSLLSSAYVKKRKVAADAAAKKEKEPSRTSQIDLCSLDELDVCCRTVNWNFHYWYHEPAFGRGYPDISTDVDEEGVSICGWVREETVPTDKGKNKRPAISRATRVSKTTRLYSPLSGQ
jgi:hypothetical protein